MSRDEFVCILVGAVKAPSTALSELPAIVPPMDWRPWLTRWSEEWIGCTDPGELDPEVIRDGWLGFAPASPEAVAAAEERLETDLPPSYREFLLTTDGWRDAGCFVWRMSDTSTLGWVRDLEPFWQDWEEPDDEESDAEGGPISRGLLISQETDAGILFLDPGDVDESGEWAAYSLFSWRAEPPTRFPSFIALMESLYAEFHEMRRPEGATRDSWEAQVEEARRHALAGDIDAAEPVLAKAEDFGLSRATVLRAQILLLLGRTYEAEQLLGRLLHPSFTPDGFFADPLFAEESFRCCSPSTPEPPHRPTIRSCSPRSSGIPPNCSSSSPSTRRGSGAVRPARPTATPNSTTSSTRPWSGTRPTLTHCGGPSAMRYPTGDPDPPTTSPRSPCSPPPSWPTRSLPNAAAPCCPSRGVTTDDAFPSRDDVAMGGDAGSALAEVGISVAPRDRAETRPRNARSELRSVRGVGNQVQNVGGVGRGAGTDRGGRGAGRPALRRLRGVRAGAALRGAAIGRRGSLRHAAFDDRHQAVHVHDRGPGSTRPAAVAATAAPDGTLPDGSPDRGEAAGRRRLADHPLQDHRAHRGRAVPRV
ncbi:hypothetical protein GCM10023195_10750 [Actinoallomurus liliacearum]|uniref:Knr4/Smi1-like domain-containing protein n=1 Tax=Actinoallomurus liliacearum TaxID=1080073 RepID=A0ABP8TET3_9ACTN